MDFYLASASNADNEVKEKVCPPLQEGKKKAVFGGRKRYLIPNSVGGFLRWRW